MPTGIAVSGDHLLVTLFRGVPFPPATSTVEQIDPLTGTDTPFIVGLKSAIDIHPIVKDDTTRTCAPARLIDRSRKPGRVLHFTTGSAHIVAVACYRHTPTRPRAVLLTASIPLYLSESAAAVCYSFSMKEKGNRSARVDQWTGHSCVKLRKIWTKTARSIRGPSFHRGGFPAVQYSGELCSP